MLIPQGLVGIGAFYLLYFFTVRESTVGTAAILLYSSPAFVVLLAWLFLKETLGPSRLLALTLTFGGIVLVVGAYNLTALEVTPFVLVTGLLSGLTYGLYSVFGKPLTGHLSPVLCARLGSEQCRWPLLTGSSSLASAHSPFTRGAIPVAAARRAPPRGP